MTNLEILHNVGSYVANILTTEKLPVFYEVLEDGVLRIELGLNRKDKPSTLVFLAELMPDGTIMYYEKTVNGREQEHVDLLVDYFRIHNVKSVPYAVKCIEWEKE